MSTAVVEVYGVDFYNLLLCPLSSYTHQIMLIQSPPS